MTESVTPLRTRRFLTRFSEHKKNFRVLKNVEFVFGIYLQFIVVLN